MGHFVTGLEVELLDDTDPARWRLNKALIYETTAEKLIIVPGGFETDFASVPRLPLAYLLTGDTAHRAAVLHDWLYTAPVKCSRAEADAVLREASAASGVPWWRRWLMWAAVRIGGGGAYQGAAA